MQTKQLVSTKQLKRLTRNSVHAIVRAHMRTHNISCKRITYYNKKRANSIFCKYYNISNAATSARTCCAFKYYSNLYII